MNLEIAAATGLVLFVFFLIQIASMKTISVQEENNETAVPFFIASKAENSRIADINIDAFKSNDKFENNKFIDSDSLN